MTELPKTPPSLIARIQQQEDGPAWSEFLEIYASVVVGFLRAKGLQDADASDVTQESFRAVARSIHGFDPAPEKGRFRNWLFVIVRSKLTDHWRRTSKEPQGSGDPEIHRALENVADNTDQPLWDSEYKQRLLNWAADQIHDEFADATWQAFWMTGVEGRPAKDVADALKMNVSNVYVCKSRVIARLRERIKQIEGE